MRVRYGTYTHPENEVNLAAFMIRPTYSDRHRRTIVRYEAHLQGEICVSPSANTTALAQAEIRQRIDEIVLAYDVNGVDFAFLDNAGVATRHSLVSSQSISGTRVTHRSWPKGDPAEWATGRTFYVIIEADYVAPESSLVAWQEVVKIIGTGGPRVEVIETVAGAPRVQTLASQTAVRVIQQGQSIGMTNYIAPPGPLIPAYEHQDQREIILESAQSYPNGFLYFPTKWTYHHTTPTYTAVTPTSA
jgi:hypothetical protein